MALMSAEIIGFLYRALCDSKTHRQQVVFGEMSVDFCRVSVSLLRTKML